MTHLLTVLSNLYIIALTNGEGYSTIKSEFNPGGKCLPIEYAKRASEGSAICIAFGCKNGVYLASLAPNIEDGSDTDINRHDDGRSYLHKINGNIIASISGIGGDCALVLKKLRNLSITHKSAFGVPISGFKLADDISSYLHEITMEGGIRPLSVSVIIASKDSDVDGNYSFNIYRIDCCGTMNKFLSCDNRNPMNDDIRAILSQYDWPLLDTGDALDRIKNITASILNKSKSGYSNKANMRLISAAGVGDSFCLNFN